MFERIRRHRHWTLGVLCGFVLVLAVAMASGVVARKALPTADVCTATLPDGAVEVGALAGHAGHAGAAGHGAAPDAAAEHAGHAGDPACVLCLALSTPPGLAAGAYRPPSAHVGRLWWAPDLPRARRDTAAPPPLRGPPASRLA